MEEPPAERMEEAPATEARMNSSLVITCPGGGGADADQRLGGCCVAALGCTAPPQLGAGGWGLEGGGPSVWLRTLWL
jgi:hypothetical protein